MRIISCKEYCDGKPIEKHEYLFKLNETLDNIINNKNRDIFQNFQEHHDKKVWFTYSILRGFIFDVVNLERDAQRYDLAKRIEGKVLLNYQATCELIERILYKGKEEKKRIEEEKEIMAEKKSMRGMESGNINQTNILDRPM